MHSSHHLDRRTVLRSFASMGACALASRHGRAQATGSLPPRRDGEMDIHHIDTGRGNSTLLIAPDGTTILIDAGAASESNAEAMVPARPDATRRPGEWIARYVKRYAPGKPLDYFVETHIHPDHVGGLVDVQQAVPIRTFIDRSFPHYAPGHEPLQAPFATEYLSVLRRRVAEGKPVQAAAVGSRSQMTLQHAPTRFPHFAATILSANGRVMGAPPTAPATNNENLQSIALRVEYGAFSYYTGGDLTFDTHDGAEPGLDLESPVARAAGRTEVAVANHHAYFDACGPEFVRALDAQVYIMPSWDVGHPGTSQLQRLLGAWQGKATHDVFALEVHPANALTNRRFVPLLKSQRGHVVVRVAQGGRTYRIFTLDPTDESGRLSGTFGPYTSRTS